MLLGRRLHTLGSKSANARYGQRRASALILALPLAVIAAATLVPSAAQTTSPWQCIICGDDGMADAVLNVLLFLPFGAVGALIGWRWRRAVFAGWALSAVIECAQIFIPGRDASVGDVCFNTLGTATGVAIMASATWWLLPRIDVAGRLSLAAAVFAVAVFGSTGYLLQPAFPRATYYGQWTARFANLEWYDGRVLESTLGELKIPSRALDDSDSARVLLRRGAPLRVRLIAGPRVPSLGPIFSIADDRSRQIILIGADREDLVYRYRARASLLRLSQPDLRLDGALSRALPGDTVTIGVSRGPGGYCLAVTGTAACGLGQTVGMGWTMLAYGEWFPAWLKVGLGAAWVGALLVPFAFWARLRVQLAVGLLLITLGLLAIPAMTQLVPTTTAEYLGALLGLAVGSVLRRLAESPSRGVAGC